MAILTWKREEIILALDLYVRSGASRGGPIPRQESAEVQELSALLRTLSAYPLTEQGETYRSPHAVHLKLMNLRAVQTDRQDGMPAYSQLDEAVWREFEESQDLVVELAAAIRREIQVGVAAPARDKSTVEDVPVEEQHATTYEVALAARTVAAHRAEQTLVRRYKEHLEAKGLKVSRKCYRARGDARAMYSDLWIAERNALVEAKSSDDRDLMRQAIGQLYDYRRFHEVQPRLAVLLPYKPDPARIDLLKSAAIDVVWAVGEGYRDSARGQFT